MELLERNYCKPFGFEKTHKFDVCTQNHKLSEIESQILLLFPPQKYKNEIYSKFLTKKAHHLIDGTE